MNEIQVFRGSLTSPLRLPAAVAIKDGDFEARDPARPGMIPGGQSWAGAFRNGRSALPLPRAGYQLRMSRELKEGFGISALASAGSRIYVEGALRWALLDVSNGLSRAGALRGQGTGALDGGFERLYQPDAAGKLEGLGFDAGKQIFWAPLLLDPKSERPLVARQADSLFVVGVQREQLGATPPLPGATSLEALAVGSMPRPGKDVKLKAGPLSPLRFTAGRCVTAAWSTGVALVFPGVIHLVDNALEPIRVLTGAFEPVALSTDEAGFLHLLVDEPEGVRALWVVSPLGVRQVRVVLPPPFDKATRPPLILHKRQIVIQAPGRLLCLSREGAIRWARKVDPAAGALVTADDQVFATDGRDLVSFDAEGQRMLIHRFEQEALVGAPLVETDGEITVATSSKVLRLRPKR